MTPLSIIPSAEDGEWADVKDRVRYGRLVAVAAMPKGTTQGKPTVMFRIEFPPSDDEPRPRTVIAETTLALYLTAGDAFVARHGDPRER